MTALGKLFRTTAFKLSAIYLVVFAALAVFIIIYIAHNTSEVLGRQLNETIDEEIGDLVRQYDRGGIGRVVRFVDHLSRRPGASLFLVTDFSGNAIAGNVASVPAAVLADPDARPQRLRYARFDGTGNEVGDQLALVKVVELPSGFRLLVGRDIGEREQFRDVIRQAFRITIVVMIALGLLSWFFVNRRVLKRIDSVSETSKQIMSGDLSGRLQITGTGDEFDRLAENLNAMLGRIEQLMIGLKEVSDNIAHDLKTPLTRLRNRVETALREPIDAANTRDVLEQVIEDSDQLIRTFDALLAIARVEASSSGVVMSDIDIAEIAAEVAEMYEPVAEDAGMRFSVDIAGPAKIHGNRELIAQALANLIDNALKYGKPEEGADEGAAEGEDRNQISLKVSRDGPAVVATVADRGPGIPEADRDKVRQRFVRLEASRNAPGSGLGLSLVQAVARMHNGDLDFADNDPGLVSKLRFPAR
ncbi:sensor histidine kinase [Rhodobium gokarnense]|uniref:histidine kinase n=1 Tax=Rhodobium gokarnense TaxID=364296 RepID=A0ABT3HBV2_9HYPH|nr:ATP-binding protein [Rhodobium gokarnense]MCW2307871.1 signal transduction histidine kinase [Rhodobium gokarnense]